MCLLSVFCNHEPQSFRLAARAHIPDCLVRTLKFCSWSIVNTFNFDEVISELTEPQLIVQLLQENLMMTL